MPKVKFPLQEEIEKARTESSELLLGATNDESRQVAKKYYDAINQIESICINRKRF